MKRSSTRRSLSRNCRNVPAQLFAAPVPSIGLTLVPVLGREFFVSQCTIYRSVLGLTLSSCSHSGYWPDRSLAACAKFGPSSGATAALRLAGTSTENPILCMPLHRGKHSLNPRMLLPQAIATAALAGHENGSKGQVYFAFRSVARMAH